MTQALNLANFANNLNSSGQTSNAGLQNSAVTVTAGTGLSGGGTASLGGSVTLNNAGVLSFNGATGAISFAGVTSVATGNGLSGGTITSTGTLQIAAPTYGSIGSYILAGFNTSNVLTDVRGGTVAGSNLYVWNDSNNTWNNLGLSGTWKGMGAYTVGDLYYNSSNRTYGYLLVRVS
jgi:hypothetical protein